MNICVFGDSICKGVVLDAVAEKYRVLKSCFANLASSVLGFELTNHSSFGCTVTKGLEIVSRHADDVARSDFTVLEFGGNDCDRLWREIAAEPDAEHGPVTPLADFIAEYRDMIEGVRADGGKPLLLNLPPIEPKRYFEWFSRGLDAQKILDWLGGDIHYIYRWHELYNNEVQKLARREGAPLIDIRAPFLARRDYASLLCEDGIHPNALGHELISETIYNEARALAGAAG